MTRLASLLYPVPLALVALLGCDVFDERLYMVDAGIDAAFDSGPPTMPQLTGDLVDACGTDAPLLFFPDGPQNLIFEINTASATDTAREVVGCTGATQSGPDLFMSIDATAGERWHFHVQVDGFPGRLDANPSVYVLSDCDERACSDGDGLDLCNAGSDEHFTFVPSMTARYVVVFDSRSMGYEGRILAFRTICGDGLRDHSENCDDNNPTDGDGCDSLCRSELSGTLPAEVEVNDDIYAANHVLLTGGTISVRGTFDRLCDVDVFAVDVPAGGRVVAALRGIGDVDCPTTLTGIALSLVEEGVSGARERVSGTIGADPVCPAIDNTVALAGGLDPGTYYLQVTLVRDREEAPVAYQLDITLE